MARTAVSVATLALYFCVSTNAEMISSTTLDDCLAMDIVELNMIEPRLAECRASAAFVETTAGSDALCDASTTCGGLLPYLAYMKKRPCLQRAAFDDLGVTLLALCDAYPYRKIDPKSVLIGKPAARFEL